MREQLRPYRGPDVLNYLCIVAADFLRRNDLREIPALCSGFESIYKVLPAEAAQALRNLRLANCAPGTMRELRLMVDNYRVHHTRLETRRQRGEDVAAEGALAARFIVNEDLTFRKTWTNIVPTDIAEAVIGLSTDLALRVSNPPPLQDPSQSADIKSENGRYDGVVEPLDFVPPVPPSYDIARVGRAPGFIAWTDLVAQADKFDRLDVENGRQAVSERSWFRRLHDAAGAPTAILLQAAPHGLAPASGIDLSDLKHLIGLPGAGKTTILYLLAGLLSDRDHRVCFLFPSIEVATGFIEKLAQYGIDAGLLSGQGDTARNKHVLNFAAALSIENRGFGVTRASAPFFATNCALAGYASDEDEAFPHANPPCDNLQQRAQANRRPVPHLCALASVCGRQHADRALISAKIWVGHVLSMDRAVSRLYTDVRLRHFEYIARAFDLVVIDECDGAQSTLDIRGTPLMKLSGDSESVWDTLIHDLHGKAARGRNAFVAGVTVPHLLEMTGRFGRATERLTARIMHFDKKFRDRNANLLLTALSLIADIYPFDGDDEEEEQRHRNARMALERIWDAAAKVVAFRHSIRDDDDDNEDEAGLDREITQAAALFQTPEEQTRDLYERLLHALEVWDRDGNETAIREIASVLRTVPGLVSPHSEDAFVGYTALLTTVSLLVLQHFGLAPHLRLMNSEGLVSDGVFDSRPSKDQLAILAESLAGRLSGVRYTVSDEGNVDIAQVAFVGTPRLLPRRMIELGRQAGGNPAVLLTSATSLLEKSPSFHINVGPDYVLQRPNAGTGWAESRYRFAPVADPLDAEKFLKFSGSRLADRERVLKSMADQLLRGSPLSEVESALRSNDVVDGVGRKAGFIVNSYEQCELLYAHIHANFAAWRGRVRYLVRASHGTGLGENALTASEVESLGTDRDWDLLIFPMSAIGRGVNIVFQFGPRTNKAMLGSLFFLTRPHPRGDSLQLIQGLVGHASEMFDQRRFETLPQALAELKNARASTSTMIEYLLRLPLAVQALGKYAEPFVADQMIIILQTIGRAMRGDCPAFVYFVDAAWAPRSAYGQDDTAKSSMLIMMQNVLAHCLNHPDPAKRECYQNLYQSFYMPLSNIENLRTAP